MTRGTRLLVIIVALIAALASAGGTAQAAQDPGPATLQHPVTVSGPTKVTLADLPAPARDARAGRPAHVPRAFPGVTGPSDEEPPAANAIDTSFTSQGRSANAPPVYGTRFEGLDDFDNPFDLSPPDPQLAVGPNHIVEMVNISGRVYDRNGTPLMSFLLADFFAVPFGYLDTDPKIIFDSISGRWFSIYLSFIDNFVSPDEGLLHIAVSQTDNPMGVWNVYSIAYVDVLPDYPGLGLTNDKVTISSNVFDIDNGPIAPGCFPDGYCGTSTVVLEKADLLAGAAAPGIFAFPTNVNGFTVRPAHSLTPVDDQYLTTFDATSNGGFLPFTEMTVIRITGTPNGGDVAEAAATDLTILPQDIPPPSLTAGSGDCFTFGGSAGPPPCIDSGDFRMLESVWRDDSLWSGASAACTPPGDFGLRSCAHLIEVETVGVPTVVQDIMFGAPNQYYSWPAIRTDASGNLYVSLTHTNTSIFAEARLTGRRASDPLGALDGTVLLKAGEVAHDSGRWGDYLGAAVDPNDPSCVWVVGEYAKNTGASNWGTYIAAASYEAGCGAQTNGDPDCDGDVDSIDAALILQFDASIITKLLCTLGADVDGDGDVDAVDAAVILQFVAGIIAVLPP